MIKLFKFLFKLGLFLIFAGILTISAVYFHLAPNLPDIDSLKTVKYQVPLRIYSRDKKFIAEFGSYKRQPVTYDQIPTQLINAFISAEDDRFFVHPGVDYQGIIRAVIVLLQSESETKPI